MRIHLTCSNPTRSRVMALHAARDLLRPCGHAVTFSWPEAWTDEGHEGHVGLNIAAINKAEIIVHVCSEDEIELPSELTAAIRFGTPVVRYEPGGQSRENPGEAQAVVARAEQLTEAVVEAFSCGVG
jgi:hypothetical protein